jgi:hypothetical protein
VATFCARRPVVMMPGRKTASGRDRILAAGAPLLAAAQAAGETTTAISLDQVLDLVAAIAKIPCDPAHRGPILDVALAGLGTSPV